MVRRNTVSETLVLASGGSCRGLDGWGGDFISRIIIIIIIIIISVILLFSIIYYYYYCLVLSLLFSIICYYYSSSSFYHDFSFGGGCLTSRGAVLSGLQGLWGLYICRGLGL